MKIDIVEPERHSTLLTQASFEIKVESYEQDLNQPLTEVLFEENFKEDKHLMWNERYVMFYFFFF